MFSYLENKEDNPLHFQCLTANVLHHDSLKLLTSWKVVLGFSVSVIVFGFPTKKRRFFCFGVYFGLRLLLYFAPGFQFAAKIKSAIRCSLVFFQFLFGNYAPVLIKIHYDLAIGRVVAVY